MLLIVGVADGPYEIQVTRRSAHVFRRARSFTLQAERIPLTWISLQAALKENFVQPRISKVVLVLEGKPRPLFGSTLLNGVTVESAW